MKIMISQPMRGKTEQEIRLERKDLVEKLMNEGYEVVDTVKWNFDFINDKGLKVSNKPVYYLSKSIEIMSIVDCIIFMEGWEKARGCRIEHKVAKDYGIKIFYENEVMKE